MSGAAPLRIAQVAPPLELVPPRGYGGTERVMIALIRELVARGHEVTTFASADSEVPGRLIPTVPRALRPIGFTGDHSPYFVGTSLDVVRHAGEFDIIHSHLEWQSLLLARALPVPLVSTFHGRLDLPWTRPLFADAPPGLVAISRSQASAHPEVPWEAIVHNGLDLAGAPFDRRHGEDLCFVGRVSPEKGILDAVEVARLSGRRIRIAAKIGTTPADRSYWEDEVRPAMEHPDVEFLGEISEKERDELFASSYATVMPGAWPEPFGLVAIESLACGTPLLARKAGALPEIVRDGIDGFLGDDPMHLAYFVDAVAGLDRAAIRESVLERFSAGRMADRYEAVYQRLVHEAAASEAASIPAASIPAGSVAQGAAESAATASPVLTTRPRRPDLPGRSTPYRSPFSSVLPPRVRQAVSGRAGERPQGPSGLAADASRDPGRAEGPGGDASGPRDRDRHGPAEGPAPREADAHDGHEGRDTDRSDVVVLPTASPNDRPASGS